MSKICHVQFKEPVNGKTDYYFGSLSAIYDTFTEEDIGCGLGRLWNLNLDADNPYKGRKCTIRVDELIRKNTNRGKK